MDDENGVFVRVYLDDEKRIYTGNLIRYSLSNDSENCVIIHKYYLSDFEGVIINEPTENEVALINIENIKRIEFVYEENSKTYKQLLGESK